MSDVSPARATHDVLIVGAGPVGLALANDLLRRGIRCRMIDSTPQAAQQTKALGIQAKTLELLAKMGVARTAIERGLTTSLFSIYSGGKRLIRIDFKEHLRESPYSYVLLLPQDETEQVLTEHLQSQGGVIEWQRELVQLTQDEQGVEATLRHADGQEERIQVGWLVGCDGAHSTVRHLLGLNFAGTTFEQSFAVGNVRLTWDLSYDEIFAFLHQGNFIGYFPMADGRHRVVIAYEPGKVLPGEVTLEEIQQCIDTCGPAGARASEPAELTRFHVNQRRTEHYAQGRIFLAGDAAHIHFLLAPSSSISATKRDCCALAIAPPTLWCEHVREQNHSPSSRSSTANARSCSCSQPSRKQLRSSDNGVRSWPCSLVGIRR